MTATTTVKIETSVVMVAKVFARGSTEKRVVIMVVAMTHALTLGLLKSVAAVVAIAIVAAFKIFNWMVLSTNQKTQFQNLPEKLEVVFQNCKNQKMLTRIFHDSSLSA